MSRLTLIVSITGAVAVGLVLLGASSPFRRSRALNSEQSTRVNLADLATVQLPQKFQPVGNGSNRAPNAKGFDAKSVEFHRNEQFVTFRFEAEQSNNMGGYPKDPILLNVTLWNPSTPAAEISRIGGTTIARFYPLADDVARRSAHFMAQQWLPDINIGASITRSAATNQGRGDNLVSAPPARWLVIHVDPVRKVRVDMYVWQKLYSLNDARALVQSVAGSIQVAPTLGSFFATVPTVDTRLAAKHAEAVASTATKLKACGINNLSAGQSAFSSECAAWMSNDQRYIHVAQNLGRVPNPGVKRRNSEVPEFKVNPMPPGKPAALMGPPDFMVVTFYWDAPKNKWSIEELGGAMYDDEPKSSALVAAIGARLTDHNSVYVMSFASYDLQFHAERVAFAEFLSESKRVATALQNGKLIAGVNAVPATFNR